jgi:hypothetical protein
MRSAKKAVQQVLKQLPANASFEDIQYHIYVMEKIERGLQDVRNGRLLTQDDVEKRMEKWL